MYRIVDSKNQTIAVTSRKCDAEAMIRTQLDQKLKIVVDIQSK